MSDEMKRKPSESMEKFFNELKNLGFVRPLHLKLVNTLAELQNKDKKPLSENAQKTLLVYFSLLAEGNVCVPLDSKDLCDKWLQKIFGAQVQQKNELDAGDSVEALPENFQRIFEKGCSELQDFANTPIQDPEGNDILNAKRFSSIPLVVEKYAGAKKNFLFTDKFWKAKETISQVFGKESSVFYGISKPSEEEIKNIIEESRHDGFELKQAQAEAILCGQKNNLIITGGPGTGKTTVVQFLLWNLFKNSPEKLNWSLYFVAPSGKAANRLGEVKNLEDIPVAEKEAHPEIEEKFQNVEGQTMHRLLSFSPAKNAFTYNAQNRLPENSIFVIDEASMIDVTLFASFLEALPQKDFRLFVLGDKNQLPSVEAGAVLGELLGLRKDAVVELTESNRFPDDSKVGRFAKGIQDSGVEKLNASLQECGGVKIWNADWWSEKNALQFASLGENAKSTKKMQKELFQWLQSWTEKFCSNLPELAQKVNPSVENLDEEENEVRKKLWDAAENARILSAERQGIQGVENINQIICSCLRKKIKAESSDLEGQFFAGQILMFTKNLPMFNLYNGDSGVVVKDRDGVDYLMVKIGSAYSCYLLSLFPNDALESAFAITIHKSQGSGYRNILMFLPSRKGHPLLNRQILYTGITRVKMSEKNPGSLTVIVSKERLIEAQQTVIQRDTGIWKEN